jgi:mannosyltransferase OCH1-like enzyme
MPVPRIIHQVYLSGDLPPVLQRNVEDLKARNPGWEHRLYDHRRAEALVAEYGGEIERTYHRISPNYPAARSTCSAT